MSAVIKRTRKAGPKARFEEIDERLKSDKYNAETRRINRNYLSKYLETKAEAGSNLVGKRRGEAERLLKAVNSKGNKTAKASPPKIKLTKKAAPKKASPVKDLYEQLDVKGDGNCYYRSLYRAAAEHEDPTVLAKVFTILGADKKGIKEEEAGQAALRASVANIYRTRFGGERFGPYEMLKNNYGSRQFKGWVREATKGQAAVYNKVKTYKSKADFYNALAAVIARHKEYASDIDYMIVSEFLEDGGVKVITTYESPKSSSWHGLPALYIKRLSYDHYNYWRFIKKASTPDPVNSGSDERREALEEKIREKKDKHQRCVEKCKAVAVKIKKLEGDLKELK